jgi:hypothetical protein
VENRQVLKIMNKVFILLLFLFVSLIHPLCKASASGGWIIYHESKFTGKIIDAETKEAIEGAVVVAVYHLRKYGIGAGIMSDSLAVDAKEVLTNSKGEFHIPSHTFCSLWPFAKGETTEFIIYKPGYTAFPSFDYPKYLPDSKLLGLDLKEKADLFKKGVIVELAKLVNQEERLSNIPSRPINMRSSKLPLLFKAINDERKKFHLGEVK